MDECKPLEDGSRDHRDIEDSDDFGGHVVGGRWVWPRCQFTHWGLGFRVNSDKP